MPKAETIRRNTTLSQYIADVFRPKGREGYARSYYLLLSASFLITTKIGLLSQARAVYLTDLGMSLSLFGILTSIGWGMLFFSQSIIGRLSDILPKRKYIVLVFLIIDGILLSGYLVSENIIFLAFVLTIGTVLHSQVFRLLMTMMSDVSESNSYGASFGLYKAMGSFAWMIAAVIAGFVFERIGFHVLVIASMATQGAIFILVSVLREPPREEDEETRKKKPPFREIFTYSFIAVCLLQLFIHFQSKAGIAYFFIFMTRHMLLPASFAGIIMAIAGLYEIPLTILGGRLFDKINPRVLIIAGSLFGVVRWILLPHIDNPYLLFFIQIQHAVIITIIFVGIPSYVSRISDPRYRGTVFGIIGSAESIGSTAGPAVIGHVSDTLGMDKAMMINGSIGAFGVAAFAALSYLPMLIRRYTRHRATDQNTQ